MIGLYRSRSSTSSGGGVGPVALGEVLPGAERAAGAGQDDRPDGSVGGDRSSAAQEGDLERDRQRVERLRAIQGERRDRPVDLDAQAVGHPAELDQPPVDDLEHPPVDRLVRAARLLDDELGEHRREVLRRPAAGSRP